MPFASIRAVLLALIVCAPFAARAAGSKPISTVLFPLRALGVPAETGAALETTLRNEVAALPEVALVSQPATTAALQHEKDADCLARLACAASAAGAAGARQFVSGTVSALGDAVLVDLKLVDARSGQELRRITHPISGRQELLIEILHAAAVELLAPKRFVGRLEVKLVESTDGHAPVAVPETDAKGAQLFIDGKLAASLPLTAPLDGIAPGQRALRVFKEGFHDATLFVEVRFERTTEAFVDLQRGALSSVAYLRATDDANAPAAEAPPLVLAAPVQEPRGPWLKIAGYSGLALGAVSLVVGVVLQTKAYSTASQLNSAYNNRTLGASDLPLYGDVDTEVNAARVLYVAAGILGAGGGALLFWDHHLDQPRATVVADPILLPDGAGVGVHGTF